MPSPIRVLDSGYVFRNPKPHVFSRHAYFPTVCQLDNGELLCGMDIGEAFESPGMRSYVCRSEDTGKTWSNPEQIFEPDTSQNQVSTTCRIGRLDSDELIGWTCLFGRVHADEGLANPDNGGFCPTDFATLRSTDGGKTWSPPQRVTLPVDWKQFETCSPPIQVTENRLLVFSSPWATWEGTQSPWGHSGVAFSSDDRGQTWSDMVTVFNGESNHLTGFEQAMTALGDGRIVVVAWTIDLQTQASQNNRIAFSSDQGRTFSEPIEIPVHGETCRLLAIENDLVLAVYRRFDQPGLWAQLAKIEGESWTPLADQILWGGRVVGRDGDTGNAISSMTGLKFGCPAIIRLNNGDVFIVFWGVEDGVSSIHWIKLAVSPS